MAFILLSIVLTLMYTLIHAVCIELAHPWQRLNCRSTNEQKRNISTHSFVSQHSILHYNSWKMWALWIPSNTSENKVHWNRYRGKTRSKYSIRRLVRQKASSTRRGRPRDESRVHVRMPDIFDWANFLPVAVLARPLLVFYQDFCHWENPYIFTCKNTIFLRVKISSCCHKSEIAIAIAA